MDYSELLNKIGAYYVSQIKADLASEGHRVTGRLSKSIYHEVRGKDTLVVGSTYTSDSGLLSLSEGRKPTNKKPNPKGEFVSHVEEWMRKRGMQPLVRRTASEGRTVKGVGLRNRGGRFRKVTPSIRKKAAYAVAIGILRNGYSGSQTIGRSYKKLEKKIEKDIIDAFKMKIDEEFKNITIK